MPLSLRMGTTSVSFLQILSLYHSKGSKIVGTKGSQQKGFDFGPDSPIDPSDAASMPVMGTFGTFFLTGDHYELLSPRSLHRRVG